MTKGRTPGPKQPLRSCSHCAGPVTAAGRKSADGIYYCRKPECAAAKARANYRRTAAPDSRPDAPIICANPACKKTSINSEGERVKDNTLPPRKVRSSDSPYGRWCQMRACQEDKRRVHAAAAAGGMSTKRTEAQIKFFELAATSPREQCPECGLVNAVRLLPHRNAYSEPCAGLGVHELMPGEVQAAWIDTIWPYDDREYAEPGD